MLYNIYLTTILAASIVSLTAFRLNYPFHLKLLAALLLGTSITELVAFTFVHILHINGNGQVYNIFMLVEFWVYAFYYYLIIRKNLYKKIITGFLMVYPVFWCWAVFYVFPGLIWWNSYVVVAGYLFTVLCSIGCCLQIFTDEELIDFKKCSEFWVAVALILFYTVNLPYFGMYYYLTANFADYAYSLKVIVQSSGIVLYAVFGYAFICQTTNTTRFLLLLLPGASYFLRSLRRLRSYYFFIKEKSSSMQNN
jgi:hypothetical protein